MSFSRSRQRSHGLGVLGRNAGSGATGRYGPELVLDWSAKAWTPRGTNTYVDEGDALKITYVDDGAGCELYFREKAGDLYAGTNLVIGVDYQLRILARVNQLVANPRTYDGVSVWNSLPNLTTEYAWHESIFQPASTNTSKLRWQNFSAGEIIYVKGLSLKEVL